MPERYGWRCQRAAASRLTTARAQETAQHVLMREAVTKTSGLAERLRTRRTLGAGAPGRSESRSTSAVPYWS